MKGSGLSARQEERSSLTRLCMTPTRPLQTVVLASAQPELVQGSSTGQAGSCPMSQSRGGCQALLVGGKRGFLLLWLPPTGRVSSRHLSQLQQPRGDPMLSLCRGKGASWDSGLNKPCSTKATIFLLPKRAPHIACELVA